MSARCTASYLMCAAGQVLFSEMAVYALDRSAPEPKPVRVKDAKVVADMSKRQPNAESSPQRSAPVTLIVMPLSAAGSVQVTSSMFSSGAELPAGVYRDSTEARRALGSRHRNPSLSKEEDAARRRTASKAIEKFVRMVSSKAPSPALVAGYVDTFDALFTSHGTKYILDKVDAVLDSSSSNSVTSLPRLVGYLERLPSMAARADALGASAPSLVEALSPLKGAPLARPLKVNVQSLRGVTVHATLRYMDIAHEAISPAVVEAALSMVGVSDRSERAAASRRLMKAVKDSGLPYSWKKARKELVSLVADKPGGIMVDPSRPVFHSHVDKETGEFSLRVSATRDSGYPDFLVMCRPLRESGEFVEVALESCASSSGRPHLGVFQNVPRSVVGQVERLIMEHVMSAGSA